MARSMRIEFPGAVYHVTSRGDRREAIFDDDQDAQRFLAVLGQATDRFGARLLAYCLMTNHYHLVLVTPTGGLSLHMRHINGVHAHVPYRACAVPGLESEPFSQRVTSATRIPESARLGLASSHRPLRVAGIERLAGRG